jgi:hypothetical protein
VSRIGIMTTADYESPKKVKKPLKRSVSKVS